MSRRRRRAARRLLLGASLALVLAAASREPLLPASPPRPVENPHLVHGLGLNPVLAADPGPCRAPASPTTIRASTDDSCLTLADQGLHLSRAKVITLADEGSSWSVHLELEEPDAAALSALTATLASNPGPRNQLAVTLHGPPGGLVLSAPAVTQPVRGLDLDGGRTEASAVALRDAILR